MPASLPFKKDKSTLMPPLFMVKFVSVHSWRKLAWLTRTWYVPFWKEQVWPSLLQEPVVSLLRLSVSKGAWLATAVAVAPKSGVGLGRGVGLGLGVEVGENVDVGLLPVVAAGV